MEKDTFQKLYRINREDISFLKFLLESYEGIAVSRTIDDKIALVEMMIPKGFSKTFAAFIDAVGPEMGMSPVYTGYPTGEKNDADKTSESPA